MADFSTYQVELLNSIGGKTYNCAALIMKRLYIEYSARPFIHVYRSNIEKMQIYFAWWRPHV